MIGLLVEWGQRHGIPSHVLGDLHMLLQAYAVPDRSAALGDMGEAGVQQRVRLQAATAGWLLWRNNVGELQDIHGNRVRYGLCNDSRQLNQSIKSADLVGIRPLTITPQHVGSVVGQFVARECKRANWVYRGDAREVAQLAFLNLVRLKGGDAAFTTGSIDGPSGPPI